MSRQAKIPKEDTFVEVFKGKEGLKYFLKDIIKAKQEVLITGIDDQKYQDALPIFMKQYFRDLRKNNIPERVITMKKLGVFLFEEELAPSTHYRFLEEKQFNPTNTFVYGNKVVIVTWGTPVTAVMIKNESIAETYRNHFEHLWTVASEELNNKQDSYLELQPAMRKLSCKGYFLSYYSTLDLNDFTTSGNISIQLGPINQVDT